MDSELNLFKEFLGSTACTDAFEVWKRTKRPLTLTASTSNPFSFSAQRVDKSWFGSDEPALDVVHPLRKKSF